MSGVIVHCITNVVTATRVADALAAIAVSPILASAPEEVGEIAAGAGALVLNCGTPTRERFAAMRAAAGSARDAGVPIVLDPVGCGASAWRTAAIRELARSAAPAVVRGNVAEVAALARIAEPPALSGVRAEPVDTDTLERVAGSASLTLSTVALVTGRGTDIVAARAETRRVEVDADTLDRVVGAGDILSALVGAFLARRRAPLAAALQAHAAFAAAASAARPRGPGSFWPAFLDALAAHD